MKFRFLIVCLLIAGSITAQNVTDLRSDGLIIPRITTDDATSPVQGQLIYDTDINAFQFFNGSDWVPLGNVNMDKNQQIVLTAQNFGLDSDIEAYRSIVQYSYMTNTSSGAVYIPFSIPIGSKLNKVTLMCFDGDLTKRIYMRVYKDRTDISSNSIGEATVIGTEFSDDNSPMTYQEVSETFIDQTRASGEGYFVRLTCATNSSTSNSSWVGTDLRFSKIIIDYELP